MVDLSKVPFSTGFGNGTGVDLSGVSFSTSSTPVTYPYSQSGGMSPWGFIRNLGTSLGHIAGGIIGLGKGLIGDSIRLATDIAFPGGPPGDPYFAPQFVKGLTQLPSAYAQRYGSPAKIARGFYEDPFSYVADALIVTGGVGTIAKAGRVGFLQKLPELVSDATATKILGGTKETLWRGVGTMTSAERAGGLVTHAYSYNPGVRLGETLLDRWISQAPTLYKHQVIDKGLLESPAVKNAENAVKNAERLGIKVLRPTVSKFEAKWSTNMLRSVARINTRDINQELFDNLAAIMNDAGISAADAKLVLGPLARGEYSDAIPAGIIYNSDPIVIPDIGPGTVPEGVVAGAYGATGRAYSVEAVLEKLFPDSVRHIRHSTPWLPYGGKDTNSFFIYVDDPATKGVETIEKAMEALGASDFVGWRNYWDPAFEDIPYDTLTGVGRMPDGTTFEISAGTPNQYLANNIQGLMLDRQAAMLEELSSRQAALAALNEEHGLTAVSDEKVPTSKIAPNKKIGAVNDTLMGIEAEIYKNFAGESRSALVSATQRLLEKLKGRRLGALPEGLKDSVEGTLWSIHGRGIARPDAVLWGKVEHAGQAEAIAQSLKVVEEALDKAPKSTRPAYELMRAILNGDREAAEKAWNTFHRWLSDPGGSVPQEIGEEVVKATDAVQAQEAEIRAFRYMQEEARMLPRLEWTAKEIYDTKALDPAFLVNEQRRLLSYQYITEPWMDQLGGSAIIHMKRKYAHMRVNQYYEDLATFRDKYTEIWNKHISDVERGPKVVAEFTEWLEGQGVDKAIVEGLQDSLSSSSKTPLKKKIRQLDRKMNEAMFEPLVMNAGELFWKKRYGWESMHKDRIGNNIFPPDYVPDMMKRPSEYGFTRTEKALKQPAIVQEQWKAVLYRDGKIIEDPIEVTARKTAIINQHLEMIDVFYKLVDEFGRQPSKMEVFDFVNHPEWNSMVLISPKKLQRELQLRARLLSTTIDNHVRTKNITKATADAIGSVHDAILKGSLNGMKLDDVWLIPRTVADAFQKQLKWQMGTTMQIYWGGAMDLWKSAVLSLKPSWVINNIVGNVVFMGIESPGSLRYAFKQLRKPEERIFRRLDATMSGKTAQGFMRENTILPSRIPEDATGFLGTIRDLSRMKIWNPIRTTAQKIRRMNTHIEQASRRGVVINEIQKQHLSHWAQGMHSTEQIMNAALKHGDLTPAKMNSVYRTLNNTLGDYVHYTPFEQYVIRQWIYPFWGFYRHAARVLLRLPFKHPLKAKIFEYADQLDRDMYKDWPDYMRDRLIMGHIGDNELWLNMHSMNPLSMINDEMPLVSPLNPLARLFLERQFGIDSVTGEPFDPENAADAGETVTLYNGRVFRIIRDANGVPVDMIPTQDKNLPNWLNHIGSQLPALTLLSPFERYPQELWIKLARMGSGFSFGVSDLDKNIAYEQEQKARALLQAQNQYAEQQAGVLP